MAPGHDRSCTRSTPLSGWRELSGETGRRVDARRRTRRGVGRGRAGRRRRGLADGRVATQPGRRSRSPCATTELRGLVPRRPARPHRGGHRRLAVLHPRLRRRRDRSAVRPGWPRPGPQLAARGLRLILDYVPNHVAPDHPWLTERPELLRPRHARTTWPREPGALRRGRRRRIFARGRDPYFPPWPDVVQLNAFAPGLRTAAVDTLTAIGDQATGCAATWRC